MMITTMEKKKKYYELNTDDYQNVRQYRNNKIKHMFHLNKRNI